MRTLKECVNQQKNFIRGFESWIWSHAAFGNIFQRIVHDLYWVIACKVRGFKNPEPWRLVKEWWKKFIKKILQMWPL